MLFRKQKKLLREIFVNECFKKEESCIQIDSITDPCKKIFEKILDTGRFVSIEPVSKIKANCIIRVYKYEKEYRIYGACCYTKDCFKWITECNHLTSKHFNPSQFTISIEEEKKIVIIEPQYKDIYVKVI